MKASVLTLALLCAGAVFAQAPAPEAVHAARHMDDLATLLDLTDVQKAQVQAILQEQHAKMRQSFEQARASGTKPDAAQMHALHQQLQQDTIQKLTPVLTSAQLAKFRILMKMQHAHMHQHGPPPGDAPPAN
jgi:hypothetical protein